MLIKLKESHFSETFLSVLFSASDKTKLSPKNFSKNSILDDLGIQLPVFLSRTNLKQHHISVSPKMIKKVVPNLDSSKASGPDYILVMGLKKCESKLNTYLLNSMCLSERVLFFILLEDFIIDSCIKECLGKIYN